MEVNKFSPDWTEKVHIMHTYGWRCPPYDVNHACRRSSVDHDWNSSLGTSRTGGLPIKVTSLLKSLGRLLTWADSETWRRELAVISMSKQESRRPRTR